jgi:SAM-dependent methyltransferase
MAPIYHVARPRYPDSLFRELIAITELAPPARLLEVGPGTGIATAVFAARGFHVVGVELAEDMAQAARDNLHEYPTVEIITGAFEAYTAEVPFDAVVAFSAFHWIDPETRYAHAATFVDNPGFLIVADARFVVDGDTDPLLLEFEEDYEAVLGDLVNRPGAPALASLRPEMNGSNLFTHIAERRYRWHVPYAASGYVDLLETLPWYRALPASRHSTLYERITRRINARASGTVTTTMEAVLDIATRK